ncbi:serine/threonine-protein kinase pim-2-like [Astyanax mexicanus]|uniref:serine/threonine-protein kinase pim-2-like n=1 Tax=Astyanax mexicanus TaxID=7994 RepID=UPI0020CB6338|nr:serine/threonine-protein kinase pim-2-like [Astyanax mexicanus]
MSWCWLWSVLLVQTGAEVPLLRFVDFGCGCLLEDSYTQFDGTTQYTSPEFFTQGSYLPEINFCNLGCLLCGKRPFTNSTQIIRKTLRIPARLSCQCKDLLRRLVEAPTAKTLASSSPTASLAKFT